MLPGIQILGLCPAQLRNALPLDASLHTGSLDAYAGAGVFLCRASRAVREVLFAAPRQAIHQALTQPHAYLGTPATSGISADLEDVCIAFQTFNEVSSLEQIDHFSAWSWCNTSIATSQMSREGTAFAEGHLCMLHSHEVAKLRQHD